MSEENNPEVFSRPNASAKIHDLEQYTLWTDTPGRPNYRARMTFGERNGAPRITVFTNLEDGPAVIVAGFEPRIFEQFLNEFEEGLRADKPFTIKIENMAADPNARPEKGTPRDAIPKVLKNTLVFGRNSDGIAFIGVGSLGISSGKVYDLNTGTDLGSTQDWVYDNYGIIIPAGYINYVSADGRFVLGTKAESSAGGVNFINWYIAPPVAK